MCIRDRPTTIQNYITAAKIFFTWTNEEGYYPNIAEHIKGAKIDKEHKKDYLTGAQVKNVLSCVDFGTTQGLRDYAIIVLMITGGLRTVEVTRANIGDIRNIGESTVLFIQGKGKIEKNDYVKLPDAVEKAIRTYLSSRKDDKSDTSPLFVSSSNNNNGKRLSSRSVSGIVKEYLIKAGYDTPRLTAHSMRCLLYTSQKYPVAFGENAETKRFCTTVDLSGKQELTDMNTEEDENG